MQLASISSTASTATVLNPALVSRSTSAPPAGSNAQTSTARSSTSAAPGSASATTTSTSAAPAKGSHAHASSSQSSATSASVMETLVSGYSTTVNGTQYSGSVEESGGEYTASVPNLAGATATGASLEAAENSLNLRIDELV